MGPGVMGSWGPGSWVQDPGTWTQDGQAEAWPGGSLDPSAIQTPLPGTFRARVPRAREAALPRHASSLGMPGEPHCSPDRGPEPHGVRVRRGARSPRTSSWVPLVIAGARQRSSSARLTRRASSSRCLPPGLHPPLIPWRLRDVAVSGDVAALPLHHGVQRHVAYPDPPEGGSGSSLQSAERYASCARVPRARRMLLVEDVHPPP